jgi:hypothetical protein
MSNLFGKAGIINGNETVIEIPKSKIDLFIEALENVGIIVNRGVRREEEYELSYSSILIPVGENDYARLSFYDEDFENILTQF